MECMMFVGSFSEKDAEGLHTFLFNESDGTFRSISSISGIEKPSFISFHPSQNFMYTTSEVKFIDDRPEGKVIAWAIGHDGRLTQINEQYSGGALPCHVTVDRKGEYLFVANYRGSNVAMYPIGPSGVLESPCEIVLHEGSSTHQRQESPHPHSVHAHPNGNFLYVPDLGTDQIVMYLIDRQSHCLVKAGCAHTEAGAGPRQLAFHPKGNFFYTINELNSTISVFPDRQHSNENQVVQTISTLPEGYTGNNTGADLQLDPSGHFLYASNRGHDSVAMFRVDIPTGRLTFLGHQETYGKMPNCLAISPSGRYLLTANLYSNNVVSFEIDAQTGMLTNPVHMEKVSMPSCIRFADRGD